MVFIVACISSCFGDVIVSDQQMKDLQAQITQLQSDFRRLSEVVSAQEQQIALLKREPKGGASNNCTCDTFPNGTITVGTPLKNLINGVNINQLASSAIMNSGDQNIAGMLSVQKLQIGGMWTLSISPKGDLQASSASSSVTVNQLPAQITQAAQEASSAAQQAAGAAQQASAVNSRVSGLTVGSCNCQQLNPKTQAWIGGYALSFIPNYCGSGCGGGYNSFGFDDAHQYIVMCSYCLNGKDGSYERVMAEIGLSEGRSRPANHTS